MARRMDAELYVVHVDRSFGPVLLLHVTLLLRDHSWPELQRAGFAVDVGLLFLLIGIALKSPKYWPMAAAGFQLLAVLTHIAKMIDPNLQQWAYITAIVIWTYLLMIALGIGNRSTQGPFIGATATALLPVAFGCLSVARIEGTAAGGETGVIAEFCVRNAPPDGQRTS